MLCVICGKESNNYKLCRECNKKREMGEIINCPRCNQWHYAGIPCWDNRYQQEASTQPNKQTFLYNKKNSMLTATEKKYYESIRAVLPQNFIVHLQANLASFIIKLDNSKYHNELFRNVDFLITDFNLMPIFIIEINDRTHYRNDRRQRDIKVSHICAEAGIPILTLWTEDGANPNNIANKIYAVLNSLPLERKAYFANNNKVAEADNFAKDKKPNIEWHGCYIATSVYGSYDCPSVYTLRRFRDKSLNKTLIGRLFVKLYYKISPTIVKWFGENKLFHCLCKSVLDKIVKILLQKGYSSEAYVDDENIKI